MWIKNVRSVLGASLVAGIAAAMLMEICFTPPAQGATPAPPSIAHGLESAVQQLNDYGAATAAAQQAQALLLVSVEPNGGDPTDMAGQWLERPDVQQRFAASGTPWVFCRLGMNEAGGLAGDRSLVEMRRGPGVFVVDHTPGQYAGRIVSILPRTAGKYYRFSPAHIDELATLPSGSLTQRSLVLAVRIHPEHPQSTQGDCNPTLAQAATSHSAHQANIRRQGHHNWQSRSQQLAGNVGGLGGYPQEVCAESWENQDLLDSCVDCVASWRQSSGHWSAVSSPQAAYGYDIRRGSNGIWYATGIFVR